MDCFTPLDNVPLISTQRFVLRSLRKTDAFSIFQIFSNAEVTRYWGHSTLVNMEQADSFIRQALDGFTSRELLEWGLTEKGQDEVIGTCAYSSWSREHRRAEIGYALRRDRWGERIMAEVLPAFIQFGFHEMGLNRIEADADPRNGRSLRSLERLGFVREGFQRERYHIDGEVQDAITYGLLRRDYGRP